MKKLIWMACLTYLINGFGHVVIGSVMEPMLNEYGLEYRDGGQLIMHQFLGFLTGVLLAPWIVKYLGRRYTLIFSLVCFTAGELIFSFLPSWGWMLVVAPLAGFGFGLSETVIAALIIGYFKEKKASVMVFIEVFFGIGALVLPALAALLIWFDAWQYSFVILAVLTGVTLFLWLFLSFDEADSFMKKKTKQQVSETESRAGPKISYSLRRLPILIAGCLFFFIYVGVEMSFANYLPTILHKTTEVNEAAAAIGISVFWGAMVLGRLGVGFIVNKIGHGKLLLISTAGTTLCFTLLSFSSYAGLSYLVIVLTGFAMAGIFSIGLIIINEAFPGLEERTTSFLVAVAGLGGAFIPRMTGGLLDSYDPVLSIWIMALFSLGMLLLMTAIVILIRRSPS